MKQTWRGHLGRLGRSPLFWLALLYVVVGVAYALVTPMLEKHDEEGHYGYIRYLRENRRLPPLQSADPWLSESKQPPLYYLVATVLTAPLPMTDDDGQLLVLNRYMDLSVPGYRNDNRNQYLHPPNLTPLVVAARLLSLAFGLGTVLAAYWLAGMLFPTSALLPIAVAACVGFQPKFLYIATAVNNDAAIVLLSTLVVALVIRRLKKGQIKHFPVILGCLLGLASLVKVSGLVLFPLAGLGLLFIYRGTWHALLRDGLVILAVALLIGGWWYLRNGLVYDDPLTVAVHTSGEAQVRPLEERLAHDLAGIEHTFWANPARTFVSEIWLNKVLIWWGRFSLGLLILGAALNFSELRANLPTFVLLAGWPLVYFLLLILYWNREFRWAFGRLLFPAIVPLFLLLVWGWQAAFPGRWRRWVTVLGTGIVVATGALIPFVSLYPLYRPWLGKPVEQVEHRVGTVYADTQTGEPVARLIGYNLVEPYALPGTYYPLELCWETLGQTDVPYALFVQLLDLSQLEDFDAPGIWGRRETYPGLGNLPTDRWALGEQFCTRLMTWVYPETPTPLGAVIEVGFVDPETSDRLRPLGADKDPATLTYVGGVPILSPDTPPVSGEPPRQTPLYVLDEALQLNRVAVSISKINSKTNDVTLTLTWQALRSVPYDATMFVHLKGKAGDKLAQVDRQPLEGRFPTSYWLAGQVITDVVHLTLPSDSAAEALTLNLGLYTWPSLQRLPVKDPSGASPRDDIIVIDVPSTLEQVRLPLPETPEMP